jgi:hypothetical protein
MARAGMQQILKTPVLNLRVINQRVLRLALQIPQQRLLVRPAALAINLTRYH